jgi:hypothetical protein
MTRKVYNGWHNYETWAANLWMDNEQGSHEHYREQAEHCYDNARPHSGLTRADVATHNLADVLRAEHEEAMPDVTGVFADLLNAALSEVNWDEIARHYVNDWIDDVLRN